MKDLPQSFPEEIARIVVDIRDLGITTIIVEQDAMAVLQYSDRAVIFGQRGDCFFRFSC